MASCLCTAQCNFQKYSCQCNNRPCGNKHSTEAPLGCDEGTAQGPDEVTHKQGRLVIGEYLSSECFWCNARDKGIDTW